MRFFNVYAEIDNNPFCKEDIKRNEERELSGMVCKATMALMEETAERKGCVFMSATARPCLSICTRSDKADEKELAKMLFRRLEYSYALQSVKEVTIGAFFEDMRNADRNGFISDETEVAVYLGLEDLQEFSERRHAPFSDRIADEEKTDEELIGEAQENYLGCRYEAELKRILDACKFEHFIGIPAHYIIGSTDGAHRRTMIRNIVSALYEKGRLLSRRYTLVELQDGSDALNILPDIYRVNDGATVLLKIESDAVDADGFRRNYFDVDAICDIVKANCSRVLTIFSIDSRFEKVKEKLRNALSGLAVVDISEDLYEKDAAVAIIQSFAQKDGAEIDENTKNAMLVSDRSYDFNTLSSMYSKWRHEYLSTKAFPEYKSFFTHEVAETEKKSNAYAELQDMIGLSPVKKLIDEAINYFKLQNEYRKRGIAFHRPTMHMVFTGSPGTAKTSVARLVARIFKDNDILSAGNLIEVGRGDIIGQYVGQTAPLVKAAFKKAKGSVLFIDEAYSLVDGKKGLYGDEAINTIVQEMENNRDDLIVIFAGYKDEMQTFLERNPGLNSRIAFHVHFDDYSSVELFEISRSLAQKSGFTIEPSAEAKLLSGFADAKRNPSFGNGRFARNIVEKAKLSLSNRMAKQDLRFVSDGVMTTLTADDFIFVAEQQPACRKIGFSS